MKSNKKQYVFRHNEEGEVIIFTRIKGEYREVCEYDICRNNSRLYPYYKITTLSLLVRELLALNYQLISIRD